MPECPLALGGHTRGSISNRSIRLFSSVDVWPIGWHVECALVAGHNHRSSEAAYVGLVEEQTAGEGFEIRHVESDADQDEVALAGHVMALLDLWLGAGSAGEAVDLIWPLALKFDRNDEGHRLPERSGIKHRDGACDHPASA